jgi:hypothetical protein
MAANQPFEPPRLEASITAMTSESRTSFLLLYRLYVGKMPALADRVILKAGKFSSLAAAFNVSSLSCCRQESLVGIGCGLSFMR